mmetsp:Transcript_39536/g.38021  ORF Transcript_39536/g.38021 Transcript_39536/m.38021 type:complete len:143 (-) Transcript_39536:217-645(-)
MYEKQVFVETKKQRIISSEDVFILFKLAGTHFQSIVESGRQIFSEYDSEIQRLLVYLFESEVVFSESFQEGIQFVQEIFMNVGKLVLLSINSQHLIVNERRRSLRQGPANKKAEECSLNFDDFRKQFKKLKKTLQGHLNSTA